MGCGVSSTTAGRHGMVLGTIPEKKKEAHNMNTPIKLWVDPPAGPDGNPLSPTEQKETNFTQVSSARSARENTYVDPNAAFFAAIICKERLDTMTFLKSLELSDSDKEALAIFRRPQHADGLMSLFMPSTSNPSSAELDLQFAALLKKHPDCSDGASVMRRLLKAYAGGHHLSDETEDREAGRQTLKALVLSTGSGGGTGKAPWLTKVVRSDGDIDTVPITDSLYESSLAPPRGIYQWAPMSYPPHIAKLPMAEKYNETMMFGALGLYLRLMVPKPSLRLERYTAIEQFPVRGFAAMVGDRWHNDIWFGRQRIGGGNPCAIRRATEIPAGWSEMLSVQYDPLVAKNTLDHWKEVFAAKRMYIVRYAGLSTLRRSRIIAGQQMYLPDPTVLLEHTARGDLVPVAIQVEPSIDYDRIYLPPLVGGANPGARDPWAWRWAKMCVQSADWNHLEISAHLTCTHLLEEVFVISTHRTLHPSHPIHQLLSPHFDRTLAINDAARRILIPIYLQHLSSLGASGVMELAGKVFSDFDFQAQYVPRELASRDMAELEPWGYFYGPDSRAIWQSLAVYCHKVVFDVYDNDGELKSDIQIQRWCDEIVQRGRVKNFPVAFTQRTDLVEALTMIIFIASAQHTAVNYLQEWYLSYVPSAPATLLCGPPPNNAFVSTNFEQLIIESLPDSNLERTQATLLRILSQQAPSDETLGVFDPPSNCRILLEHAIALRNQLKPLAKEIQSRHETVATKVLDDYAYPVLNPTTVALSIRI